MVQHDGSCCPSREMGERGGWFEAGLCKVKTNHFIGLVVVPLCPIDRSKVTHRRRRLEWLVMNSVQ